MSNNDSTINVNGDWVGHDKVVGNKIVYNFNIDHLPAIVGEKQGAQSERKKGQQRIELKLPFDSSDIDPDKIKTAVAAAKIAMAVILSIQPDDIEELLVTLGCMKLLFRLSTDAAIRLVKIWKNRAEAQAILGRVGIIVERIRFVTEDRDLSGVDLHKADLSNANLRWAILHDADLSGADLSGADLSRADLSGAKLSGANLQGTIFTDKTVMGVDINNGLGKAIGRNAQPVSDVPGDVTKTQENAGWGNKDSRDEQYRLVLNWDGKASFRGFDLSKQDLSKLALTQADFSGANLSSADLRLANLRKANLGGAILHLANLGGVNLIGANLVDANLCNAILINANLGFSNLRGANLSFANLSDAYLSDANLGEVNLSGAILCGAILRDANLPGADLRGAIIDAYTQMDEKWRLVWQIVNQGMAGKDLSRKDLSHANLRFANLRHTTLSEAILTGTILSGAILAEADLSGAILIETDLSGADLSGVDLHGANLHGANLHGTNLHEAELRDVIMPDGTKHIKPKAY